MRILHCAFVFSYLTSFLWAQGDQSEPFAPHNSTPPSATSTGTDSPVSCNHLFSETRTETMAEMAQESLSQPDKRVYIEYNGELLPLKGIVKVPQIEANGAEMRIPLSEEETRQVMGELTQLEATSTSLRNSQKTHKSELTRLNKKFAELAKKSSGPESASAASSSESMEVAKAEMVQTKMELIQREFSESQELAQLQEVEQQMRELDVLRVIGKRVYTPMRVDSQGSVIARTRTGGFAEAVPIGPDGSRSNGGSSTSSVASVEKRGFSYRRPEFRLPAPSDPNDLFASTQTESKASRLGLASELSPNIAGDYQILNNISTVARLDPTFGAFYDTRTLGSPFKTFKVSDINTKRAPTDGTTTYIGDKFQDVISPTSFILDNQVAEAALPGTGDSHVQFYVEGNNYRELDKVNLRHVFARVWNKGTWTVGAGKTHSLFSTNGLSASTLSPDITLIGTSGLGAQTPNQLRVQKNYVTRGSDWGWGLSIEDPDNRTDFTVAPASGTRLNRLPIFVSNMTVIGANQVDRIQIAGLFRNLGTELPSGSEVFEQGWGASAFSAYQLFGNNCRSGTFFAGAAGGHGIGNYINGVDRAAVVQSGNLIGLNGYGTYAGYKYQRIAYNGWQISSDIAYGMSGQSVESSLDKATSTHLHHAWVNTYVETSKNVAVGAEWQYGRRLTFNDGNGENSRIFFGVRLTSNRPAKKNSEIANTSVKSSERYVAENSVSNDRQIMNAEESRSSYAHMQGL